VKAQPWKQYPHVGSFQNTQYVVWVAPLNENQGLDAIPTCKFIMK
jgi:hypothetical protein